MTPEEREAWNARLAAIKAHVKAFEQERRDKRLRAGRAKPRNRREMAIFAKDLLKEPPGEPR